LIVAGSQYVNRNGYPTCESREVCPENNTDLKYLCASDPFRETLEIHHTFRD